MPTTHSLIDLGHVEDAQGAHQWHGRPDAVAAIDVAYDYATGTKLDGLILYADGVGPVSLWNTFVLYRDEEPVAIFDSFLEKVMAVRTDHLAEHDSFNEACRALMHIANL
jgi:hypothetical protein